MSSLTLIKLAKAFDIEAYELMKPEKPDDSGETGRKDERVKALIDRFSADLTVVLKDSVEKAVEHVRKEYEK